MNQVRIRKLILCIETDRCKPRPRCHSFAFSNSARNGVYRGLSTLKATGSLRACFRTCFERRISNCPSVGFGSQPLSSGATFSTGSTILTTRMTTMRAFWCAASVDCSKQHSADPKCGGQPCYSKFSGISHTGIRSYQAAATISGMC